MKYSASLFFGSEPDSSDDMLWEEIIILVEADSEEEALEKAKSFGEKENVSYVAQGKSVTWKFNCVERVCLIENELTDGVELFSRFLKRSEAVSMLTSFKE